MKTEYKAGDKVLIEAEVIKEDFGSKTMLVKIKAIELPHNLILHYDEIYSHVPEIKPGTRVDIYDIIEGWISEAQLGGKIFYVGKTLCGKNVIEKDGFAYIKDSIRPHVEEPKEESPTNKLVTVEVPEGYKVQVVKED